MLTAAIVYPIFAAALTAISLFLLNVEFDEKRAVHEKNEQFELPVQIRNKFLFPYAPAALECIVPDVDTGLFLKKQIFASIAPLKHMRIFLPCMHRYRGAYPARIMKLSVFDPLRIIRFSRKLDVRTELIFLPRKVSLDKLGFVFSGDHGAEPEQRITGDKEDFSHVREYANGDSVQLIHWKLTAKLDELMTKQYDSESDRRSVILCNFGRYGATPSAVIRQCDAVIDAAVAVAMSAVNAGIKAFADTGALSELTCDIPDDAGFRRFYDMMAVLPPEIAVMDFAELADKYSCGNAAAMFMITHIVDDSILSAAERAAERLKGTVVLMYIDCTGRQYVPSDAEDKKYIFVHIRSDSTDSLPAAAEQIYAEYRRING